MTSYMWNALLVLLYILMAVGLIGAITMIHRTAPVGTRYRVPTNRRGFYTFLGLVGIGYVMIFVHGGMTLVSLMHQTLLP